MFNFLLGVLLISIYYWLVDNWILYWLDLSLQVLLLKWLLDLLRRLELAKLNVKRAHLKEIILREEILYLDEITIGIFR